MNKNIKYEYNDFSNHHNNILNLFMHILFGTIYLSSLNIFNPRFLKIYLLLLIITIEPLYVINTSVFIYFTSKYLKQYNFKKKTYLFIFFLNCFVFPQLSHLILNENTVLDINTITLYKLSLNIIYFLPFSIQKLYFLLYAQ